MSDTRFLPFARRRRLVGPAITVRAEGREVSLDFQLYGPGDVARLALGQIRRREPAPGSEVMAPNLFPYVEFTVSDFPWRLSPVEPDAAGRLMPWLALIAIELAGDGQSPLRQVGAGDVPVVEIACKELPPHDELALWAHVEVPPSGAVNPDQGIARLVSPVKLQPRRRYLCCLVPTFEAGRLAGLGETPPDPLDPAPAWTDRDGTVVLPVYDTWQFATIEDGDLETLARNLKPAALSAPPFKVDVTDAIRPALATTTPPSAVAPFSPVLLASLPDPDWSPKSARQKARTVIGKWLNGTAAGTIGPPIYGAMVRDGAKPDTGWTADVNLDPVLRSAAGLGAAMVRVHQDDLSEAAWSQAGAIHKARREREGARLASLLANRLYTRNVAPLQQQAATLSLVPALARVAAAAGGSVAAALERSALPSANLSAAYRRILRAKVVPSATTAATGLSAALQRLNQQVPVLNAVPPTNAHVATRARIAAFQGAGTGTPTTRGSVFDRATLGSFAVSRRGAATGTSRSGSISTSATFATSAAPMTRFAALNLALDAEKARMIEAFEPALNSRAPTLVQLQTPPAFAWAMPPRPGDSATASAVARTDLGDVGRFLPGRSVAVAPHFDQPLVDWLDPEFLLGKVDPLPETVGGLGVNARLIEAVMIGANHEMARELRWRGVPLDLSATFFRRFFDGRITMSEMAGWQSTPLGEHYPVSQSTVFLFRSKLVEHLSELTVYLAPAKRIPERVVDKDGATVAPLFQGRPGPGMAYFGFDLAPAVLHGNGTEAGWYLVLEERSGGTKFGFDEQLATALQTWNDVAWPDLDPTVGYLHVEAKMPVPSLVGPGDPVWGSNGAHMAAISRQKPFRLVVHASEMIL